MSESLPTDAQGTQTPLPLASITGTSRIKAAAHAWATPTSHAALCEQEVAQQSFQSRIRNWTRWKPDYRAAKAMPLWL
ncbi:MAG: hypothetical protein IPG31_00915 [Nitrosomonas sp.]|nr:hypothetical protein [Nitrosomonas sp.]